MIEYPVPLIDHPVLDCRSQFFGGRWSVVEETADCGCSFFNADLEHSDRRSFDTRLDALSKQGGHCCEQGTIACPGKQQDTGTVG